jgi:hypothetical protein
MRPLVTQCDHCAFVVRIPEGRVLPEGWINDPYLGYDLCPDCGRRAQEEKKR